MALEGFARNDLTVKWDYKRCCGIPALDGEDGPRAQQLARANIAQLMP